MIPVVVAFPLLADNRDRVLYDLLAAIPRRVLRGGRPSDSTKARSSLSPTTRATLSCSTRRKRC